MRKYIPGFELRRRARGAMKTCLPILVLVALIAVLPSLLQQTLTLMTKSDPVTLLVDLADNLLGVMDKYGLTQPEPSAGLDTMVQAEKEILAVYGQFARDSAAFYRQKGAIIVGLLLMVLLLSPVLGLGLLNALLHALRGQEVTAGIALSRMRYMLKALGLTLLIGLKTAVWMLPGMALMTVSVFLPEWLMMLAMLAGMAAMIILGVRAAYSYAMAEFILADLPETGIRACIRRSCEVMDHRRMELFSLQLSFIGWFLLLMLARSLFYSFGQLIGMTLSQFASLFLTVYVYSAQASFYQAYAVDAPAGGEMDESAGLNMLNS